MGISLLQIIRTEEGFAVLLNGKQFPIPIGYMRVSEVPKVEYLLTELLSEVEKSNSKEE